MSKLDEVRSRTATITLSTRMDARYLATLARYFHSQGDSPRSLSELTRLASESLCDILVVNQKVGFIEETASAFAFLESLGLTTDTCRKNSRNIKNVLSSEDLNLNPLSAVSIPSSVIAQDVTKPVASITTSAIAEEVRRRLAESTENDITDAIRLATNSGSFEPVEE